PRTAKRWPSVLARSPACTRWRAEVTWPRAQTASGPRSRLRSPPHRIEGSASISSTTVSTTSPPPGPGLFSSWTTSRQASSSLTSLRNWWMAGRQRAGQPATLPSRRTGRTPRAPGVADPARLRAHSQAWQDRRRRDVRNVQHGSGHDRCRRSRGDSVRRDRRRRGRRSDRPGSGHIPLKLGVAVSGQGTNLRNLVELGFDVAAAVTNRPSCGAADFARRQGIPLGEFSQKSYPSAEHRDAAMRDFLVEHGVEIVVDAGYDRIHTRPFLDAF